MKKIALLQVTLFLFLLTQSQHVFQISLSQEEIDAAAMNVQPGDTLGILPGKRGALHIKNISGTKNKPVIIINYGGPVIINTKLDYGIYFDHSFHFRLTGTGSMQDTPGIEIASSANHGVVIAEFSSYGEVDHLHIHGVGYAGIVAKTDPNCERKNVSGFVMRNLSFHDNYIHDTKAEGFYIGYSWYPAREFKCGADSVLLYSHEIHGIRIFNNRTENTGQEGIQVGCGTKDVKIYLNSVRNYGTNNTFWHNHGVQIGQGTTGEFFYNVIDKGPGEAISLFGIGNNYIHHNLIINSGASAIYQNDRGANRGSRYEITGNTIIDPVEHGVTLVADKTRRNKFMNNTIVISDMTAAVLNTGKNRWINRHNNVHTSADSISLPDPLSKKIAFVPFRQ